MPNPFRIRRSLLAAGILAATALALSGCSAGGSATPDATSTPVSGGTLNVGLNAALTCIDPNQNASNVTIYVSRNVVDSLTEQDPDTGEIKPWIAQSWDVNADSTAVTFHLKPGVTFTDGTPLNAAAVKANYDNIKALGTAKASLANSYLSGYESTEVVDDTTAIVHFSKPNVQFLQGSSTVTLGLLSTATLQESADDRCAGKIVASGPFTLTSYDPNSEVKLTKNPDYNWASAVRAHTGAAYLDAIDFHVVLENGVRSGQLSAGTLDLDTIPLTEDLPRFSSDGFAVDGRPYPGIDINLSVNQQRPLLQDVNVRKALLFAVDRDSLVSSVLSQYDKPATSLLSSETPDYAAIPDVKYDPTQATALLDAAGWKVGSDGIRVKDGTRLSLFAYFSTFRQSAQVMQVLQQQFKAVGVDLQIKQATAAEATAYAQSGDYDFGYSYFIRADPDVLKTQFSTRYTNGSKATPDQALDDQLDQQAQTVDPAARQALVTQLQTELIDRVYAIPLFEFAQIVTKSDAVNGPKLDASSRFNFYDTYLTK